MCYIQLYRLLLYSIIQHLCVLFLYTLDGVSIYVAMCKSCVDHYKIATFISSSIIVIIIN